MSQSYGTVSGVDMLTTCTVVNGEIILMLILLDVQNQC